MIGALYIVEQNAHKLLQKQVIYYAEISLKVSFTFVELDIYFCCAARPCIPAKCAVLPYALLQL